VPRRPRQESEPGVHHVYARGNGQQPIYRDDIDRETYLRMLGRVVVRHRWQCLAYCLMGNHVHLLLETREPNLGRGMGRLHSDYAQRFNRRHGRSGHLFQGRYGAVRVQDDIQLWTVVRYIARNPVQAGMCERAEEWAWSSHRAVLGAPAPAWLDVRRLLWHLGALGGEPRERYRDIVAEGA
jgi:REP element-mobilizing transposase RayT